TGRQSGAKGRYRASSGPRRSPRDSGARSLQARPPEKPAAGDTPSRNSHVIGCAETELISGMATSDTDPAATPSIVNITVIPPTFDSDGTANAFRWSKSASITNHQASTGFISLCSLSAL